jgi:hypothetical protein
MACDAPAFFLLLEDGSYLLQEDAVGRLQLELATTTGVFLCPPTIPSGAQLFPPSVSLGAAPAPGGRSCEPLPLQELAPLTGCVTSAAVLPAVVRQVPVQPGTPRVVSPSPPSPAPAAPALRTKICAPAFPTDVDVAPSTCRTDPLV